MSHAGAGGSSGAGGAIATGGTGGGAPLDCAGPAPYEHLSCLEYGLGAAYCNADGECVGCPNRNQHLDCDRDGSNYCETVSEVSNCGACGTVCQSWQSCVCPSSQLGIFSCHCE